MDTLRIRWDGGEATFEPGTTVRIGRDPDADVQPANTNVSRRHVEIAHSPSGWVLRDVGSAQGTWRDGRQVQSVDVRGTVQVTLGHERRGEVVTLEASPTAAPLVASTELVGHTMAVAAPTEMVGASAATRVAGGGSEGTVVVGAPTNRPGGALRADAIAGATVVTGDALNVECAGRSYTFTPGRDISIGRDTECEVVSQNPTVSRRHARITHDGAGWTLRDDGSSSGTYVDGKRITEHRLVGSVAAWLGDETAGERLVVVASGTNPATARRRSLRRAAPVLGAAAVLLVVVLGWLLTSGGGSGPSEDELARATVRLVAADRAGSGTIIDATRGLILTNAHVVAPDALGTGLRDVTFAGDLDVGPREVDVLVAPELEKAAEPRFVAEIVAVDGYLDLAVLKITKTVGGQLIEPGSDDLDGLVDVRVGDSNDLTTGDPIRVFGYPGAADSTGVTFTEGVISGQVKDERIGSNQAMVNISAAIRPGNSGGLVVNGDGELVGVPTLLRDGEVPSTRPTELALRLIDDARTGTSYESALYRPLADETIGELSLVSPMGRPGIAFECSTAALPAFDPAADAVGIAFNFDGWVAGEHQDLMVVLKSGDVFLGVWTLNIEYPVRWPAEAGCATVTVPIDTSDVTDPSAPLTAEIGLGPNYSPPG